MYTGPVQNIFGSGTELNPGPLKVPVPSTTGPSDPPPL